MSGLRMATVELPEERVTMAVEGEEVVLQLQGAWPASQPASRAEPGRGRGGGRGQSALLVGRPVWSARGRRRLTSSRSVAVPHALWPCLTLCGRASRFVAVCGLGQV
jgi:hypothetical protein